MITLIMTEKVRLIGFQEAKKQHFRPLGTAVKKSLQFKMIANTPVVSCQLVLM